MPRLKKKEVATPPAAAAPEAAALTLTAGRSRRTIKPNRKYLNDSIVSMPPSKTSSRSSSPDDSDLSEDEYRKNARDEDEEEDDDDDEEVVPVKSAAGRKSVAAAAAKKTSLSPGSKPRGRPPKSGKAAVKTEPVKNLRKEVMKKMDLTTLSVGKARVLLTPLKQDPKRKLNLDETVEKEKPTPKTREAEKVEKPRETVKQKVVAKQREPEKVPPAAVARERAKSEARVVRKKAEPPPPAQASKKEDADALKKVINPVAVKKQLVEKSILDKRAKKVEEEEEEEDDDDDDDDVQIVGISRETNPVLGRKAARKSPLVAKQISPLPRKVPGKATPPVAAGLKRKAEVDAKPQQGRPVKNAKLSITVDSDDSESSGVEEVEDEEPARRTTRSSLPSDKGSAASTPQNSSVGKVAPAKESPASARGRKESDSVKSSLTKSISMPALDKSKQGLPGKSVQTPAAKTLSKPMAASTPKPSAAALPSKSKSELNLVDPILSTGKAPTSADRAKAKSATIRIVDIGDIMKKRAASTPDVRKDAYESSSSSSDSDDGEPSKPKTNTELVASILERKQAVNVDHLRTNRPSKRGRPASAANKASPKGRQSTPAAATPTEEDDEIDFEDMLQTNIVTANKVQKVMQPAAGARQRRSDENTNKRPGNNNNNLYKSNNNGRFGSSSSLNRSGSASPHKNPPRILNSTMKMGDSRPFAKLVSNSGNKHYSIDLTDPDNNVKLVASPDSPPPPTTTTQPIKRGPPVKTITRPATAAGGLRNAGNALNKPIGGAVQRSVSSLTAGSTTGSPKMKKITCYETWYVINIPNSENKPEKPSFAMSMIGLGNKADKIQLPSDEWSHKIILTKRKTAPADGDEVFNGDVEDRAISEEEKRNYEPCNIMFRRRTAVPGKFNLQYDRAVIFKNDTFFINVDGKNCQLVGAPTKLDDAADIETLLSVVDFVNLKNTCVELSAA